MATITLLGTVAFDTNSGTHTVTATPAVNDLIVIVTASTGNTSSATPTDDNSSGTYTLITSSVKNSSADTLGIHIRDSLIGSATSTVFTHAPGTSTGGGLAVFKVTGMTKTGATAAVQSAIQSNISPIATPAPVFGAVPKTDNAIIGAVFNASSPATLTPRSGYTERSDSGYNAPITGLETMSKDSGETSATITWGSSSVSVFSDLVIELDVAPSISKTDSVAVSESYTVSPVDNTKSVNVSDSPTISESTSVSITAVPTLSINKSDSVTITENKSAAIALDPIVVSDSITSSESLTYYSDQIDIIERIQIAIASNALSVNVSDSITITEAVVTRSFDIIKSDSIAVTESLGRYSDNIYSGESIGVSIAQPEKAINVSDNITITESNQFTYFLTINVSDSISSSEHIDILNTSRQIAIVDNRLLDENGDFILDEDGNYITDENPSDIIIITESLTFPPFIQESVSASEVINVAITANNQYNIFLYSDQLTVSENIQLEKESLVSVSDSSTINESASIQPIDIGINTSDNISITESFNSFQPLIQLSFADTITVSENTVIIGATAVSTFTKLDFSIAKVPPPTFVITRSENKTFSIEKIESPIFNIKKVENPTFTVTKS